MYGDWTMEKFKDQIFQCIDSKDDAYYMEESFLNNFNKLTSALIDLKSRGKRCKKCTFHCLKFAKQDIE